MERKSPELEPLVLASPDLEKFALSTPEVRDFLGFDKLMAERSSHRETRFTTEESVANNCVQTTQPPHEVQPHQGVWFPVQISSKKRPRATQLAAPANVSTDKAAEVPTATTTTTSVIVIEAEDAPVTCSEEDRFKSSGDQNEGLSPLRVCEKFPAVENFLQPAIGVSLNPPVSLLNDLNAVGEDPWIEKPSKRRRVASPEFEEESESDRIAKLEAEVAFLKEINRAHEKVTFALLGEFQSDKSCLPSF